ncbi:MAG: DUF3696 domain-containing protein [Planctomycetaceae bacterium]
MLKQLSLANFKPFEKTEAIRFAPITLIYGPNSSGKSSLIQSLLLMKQSLQRSGDGSLVPRGSHVDLGSYASLIHRHETSRPLVLGVGFRTGRAQSDGADGSERRLSLWSHAAELDRDCKLQFAANTQLTGPNDLQRVLMALRSGGRSTLEVDLQLVERERVERQRNRTSRVVERVFELADSDACESMARFLVENQRRSSGGSDSVSEAPSEATAGSLFFSGRETIEFPFTSGAEESGPIRLADLLRSVEFELGAAGLPGVSRNLADILDNCGAVPQPDAAGSTSRPSSAWRPLHSRDMLLSISADLIQFLESVTYLGPLRSFPARYYTTSAARQRSVGSDGALVPDVLSQRPEVVTSVNHWFRAFDIPYRLDVASLGNAVTGDLLAITLASQDGTCVAPADVGFGISQLLPILVEGRVAERQTLCVEQPEIHLHPRLQARLADFFIQSAGLLPPLQAAGRRPVQFPRDPDIIAAYASQYGVPRNQWIIETHSETLMLRLQRRIREGLIQRQDVCVLYVRGTGAGSDIMELRLDENGEFIDEWPDGFFDDGYQEIYGGGA